MSYDNVNQALMGGGGRSASFKNHDDRVWGEIIKFERIQQRDFDSGEPKVWDDGNPQMQIVISLQTDEREDEDDDGVRKVYVKEPSQMLAAMRLAVTKAGAKGIANGGKFLVQYVSDGEPKRKGMSGQKQYFVRYEAPPEGYMPMAEEVDENPPIDESALPFDVASTPF